MFVNGVNVGRVQNVQVSAVDLKVSVEEIGDLETIEHVMNGRRVTVSIGFVLLRRRSLEVLGVVFPTDKTQIPDFDPIDIEFRTLDDDPIMKITNCTPSSNQFQVTREAVWGRNVSFDGTWFYMAESM